MVAFDQAQPFEIHQDRNGSDAVVVRLSGEFDMGGCDQFDAAVRMLGADGLRKIVIDLAELTFIDSSGIRSLLDTKRRAEEQGLDLVVRVPENGQVRQVLELTGVGTGAIEIHGDKVAPVSFRSEGMDQTQLRITAGGSTMDKQLRSGVRIEQASQ